MIKNIYRLNHQAFSLLEMSCAVILMAILASAVIPVLTRSYLEKAGEKASLDIFAIEDSARAFFVANGSWPSSISDLQAGNFLPSGWNAVNPFGYPYTISINGTVFNVATQVVNGSQIAISNRLPLSEVNGTSVYSSVPIPGSELNALPTGSIISWSSVTIPSGFLLCNGQQYNIADYTALYHVIGNNYGGDAMTTFNVPNLQGRAIFGYQAGDSHFGALGSTGGSTSMVGNGQWSSGHADTANWVNQVKISGGSLYGMTGAQTAQGVSTAVLNPYMALNFIIKA